MENHRQDKVFRMYYCTRRKILFSSLLLCSLVLLGSCGISKGQFSDETKLHRKLKRSPILTTSSTTSTSTTTTPSPFLTNGNLNAHYDLDSINQVDSANHFFSYNNHRLPQFVDLNGNTLVGNSGASTGRILFPSSSQKKDVNLSYTDKPLPFRFPEERPLPTSNSIRNGRTINSSTNGSAPLEDVDSSSPDHSPLFRPGPQHLHPSLPLSSIASSVESSRKASPDVQDIIDGIVKLLGGKVHNNNNNNNAQTHQSQAAVASQRPYNLFNPTKPLFFSSTARPTRINNRGPVLGSANGNQQQQHLNSAEFQQQQTFEAIPLEALNKGFNLTQSKFGPPFPLSQLGQDAPYKQGIPLPEQIVPNFQQQGSSNENNGNYNGNNRNPLQKTPTEEYFGIESPGESVGFHHRPAPSVNNNAHVYHHVSVSSSTSSSVGSAERGTTHYHNPATTATGIYDYFNQNVQSPTTKRPTSPTTLLVPTSSESKEKNEPLTPVKNQDSTLTDPLGPLQSQAQTDSIEDDEKDQQVQDEMLNKVNSNNSLLKIHSKPQPAIVLEPTITDAAQLPTFIFESSAPAEPTGAIRPSAAQVINWNATFVNGESTRIQPTSTMNHPTFHHPSTLTGPPEVNWALKSPTTTKRPLPVYYNKNGHEAPSSSSSGIFLTESNAAVAVATPPLRPGIVIHEGNPGANSNSNVAIKGQGFGSVEVVTADDHNKAAAQYGSGKVGDVFDITVTAKQGFGVGPVTGQPFITPVDIRDEEIITAPNVNQQFVSIDGKRTYFNLHPNTAVTAIGSATPTKLVEHLVPAIAPPVASPPPNPTPRPIPSSSISSQQQTHPGVVGQPTHPFAPKTNNIAVPSRAVSTSLSIQSNPNGAPTNSNSGGLSLSPASIPANKTPPNIIRRPLSRKPSIPPVRIDTCIVGDDSTCNSEQSEVCRTESGVSSCICRAGYARRRHREPCRAILTLVMSIRLDKIGDKKLSYDPEYFNPNSEIYQSLEWETIHGIDSIVSETTLQSSYVGAKLDAIGFDGRFAVVNSTILMQETPKMPASQMKRELQRQFIQILSKHRNNFGKTQLWVEEPVGAISAINDANECENSDLNDCDTKAKCINTFGSFECKCDAGYGDPHEKDRRRSGRKCESCNGKLHCNGRGECLIENSQKVCRCAGNYYGSQCDIDGEVMAVAIGASVSALIIIGLTLACLCMWSRRWKREEQKAALMSRTLFGGMASQALSYISNKNSMHGSSNPYQQHVGLEERLRWAQVNDSSMTGNIYVQNEPLSLHASPTLMGTSLMDTPPIMSTRRSSDTCDTTVDDLFEERHQIKRPKSRSSQLQQGGGGGGIYYDLEPDTDIYATRGPPTLVPFSQFCVPMNPYSHSRGFYN